MYALSGPLPLAPSLVVSSRERLGLSLRMAGGGARCYMAVFHWWLGPSAPAKLFGTAAEAMLGIQGPIRKRRQTKAMMEDGISDVAR
jgi:hypothetical protein